MLLCAASLAGTARASLHCPFYNVLTTYTYRTRVCCGRLHSPTGSHLSEQGRGELAQMRHAFTAQCALLTTNHPYSAP